MGSQVGGPDAALATGRNEQQLRDAMNRWTGNYSSTVKEFAFLLRVDGEFHAYTQEWKIDGAQKAKRKRDWVEVEIGIPRTAWEANEGRTYKRYLASEVEKGLRSMIEVFEGSGREINAEALINDWLKIKREYLKDNSTLSTTIVQ